MWIGFVFILVTVLKIVRVTAMQAGKTGLVKLNDGRVIPRLGLGTWLGRGGLSKATLNAMEQSVKWAIDAGYRHIDTASIYKTEEQVGRAVNRKIAEGVINREDVFITTKLWNDQHKQRNVIHALQNSLQELNMSYVDLYLIHWPVSENVHGELDRTSYKETWNGMIEAQKQGLTKSIGVSNFNIEMLRDLIDNSDVKPANLQVEINLNLQQPELLAFCREHNISVTAYSPFGSLFPWKATAGAPPPRVDDNALVYIAMKKNKTVPQIVLRYLNTYRLDLNVPPKGGTGRWKFYEQIELGVIPIPKSLKDFRIEQNIDVFDFELTDQERDLLRSFDKGFRTIDVKHWKRSPYYPF